MERGIELRLGRPWEAEGIDPGRQVPAVQVGGDQLRDSVLTLQQLRRVRRLGAG